MQLLEQLAHFRTMNISIVEHLYFFPSFMFHQMVPLTLHWAQLFLCNVYIYIERERERERERDHGLQKASYLDDHSFEDVLRKTRTAPIKTISHVTALKWITIQGAFSIWWNIVYTYTFFFSTWIDCSHFQPHLNTPDLPSLLLN